MDADISPTIEAAMGTGGNNIPVICFDSHDLLLYSNKSNTIISGGKDKARIPIVALKTNDG